MGSWLAEKERHPGNPNQSPSQGLFSRKIPLCCPQGAILQIVLHLIEKQSIRLALPDAPPAGRQSHVSWPQAPVSRLHPLILLLTRAHSQASPLPSAETFQTVRPTCI